MDIKEFFARGNFLATRHPWESTRLYFIKKIVDEIINNYQNKPRHLLDLGCGDAFVASALAGDYPSLDVYGIDTAFTAEVLSYCSKEFSLPNLKLYSDFNDGNFSSDFFDIVLLLDVIEHIEDDASFLADLAKNAAFSPSCHFVISAPAFQSLFSHHDQLLGHYRRYTVDQLIALAEKSGLVVKQSGYFFIIPLILRTLNLLREKTGLIRMSETTDVAAWNHGEFFTKLLYYMLRSDVWLSLQANRFNFKSIGLSGYVICQIPG